MILSLPSHPEIPFKKSSTISAEAREDNLTSEAKKKKHQNFGISTSSEMYNFFCVKINLKTIPCFQVVSSVFSFQGVKNYGS